MRLLRGHATTLLEFVKNVCTTPLEITVNDVKTGSMEMLYKKRTAGVKMIYLII